MNSPAVSILLPALNAEATLDVCLRSIERQTLRDWQCIVVDDGSTDRTLEIARGFARRDGRFEVIEQGHHGVVAALQFGLKRCTGDHIARMDADDLMHRDRLSCQVDVLRRRPSSSAVGSRVRLFPRAGLRAGRLAYERWLNCIETPAEVRREMFVECPLAHPTMMVRGDVLRRFGYRQCPWPEDYDLLLRLLQAGHELEVVARRLLSWRDLPTRLSRVDARYSDGAFTRCKAAFLAGSFLAASATYVLWGYGGTGKALRRELAALGKLPSHIVELHPGRLGQTIHGAPVIAPEKLPQIEPSPIIASVAGAAPRREIRERLAAMGFRELEHFVCAA